MGARAPKMRPTAAAATVSIPGADTMRSTVGRVWDLISFIDVRLSLNIDLTMGTARDYDSEPDVISTIVNVESVEGALGSDEIRGDNNANYLNGLKGGDRVEGLAGDDILVGSYGSDSVIGGEGNDLAVATQSCGTPVRSPCKAHVEDRHPDSADGGPGDDLLYTGKNRDFLKGGPGEDELFAGPGSDNCSEGEENHDCEVVE
jgi:Ca2+-binding RTX toxin-like protein